MKKISVKLYVNILMIVGIIGFCLTFNSMKTLADSKPAFPTKIDLILTQGSSLHGHQFGESGKTYKISNLKSSKKSVVTATSASSNGRTFIDFNMHGTGKASITFTAKVGGKSYNYKTTVRVWKYSSPIKILKIGKTDYASRFKTVRTYNVKSSNGNFKLALNKGWKLVSIRIYKYTNGGGLKRYTKAPSKISLKKNHALDIEVINTSKKYTMDVVLFAS